MVKVKSPNKAKGALARAQILTKEERKNIASAAARARWNPDVPKAEFYGELKIGDEVIPCAVLPDGTRVLSRRGVMKALGRSIGGADYKKQDEAEAGTLPVFIGPISLEPFVSADLMQAVSEPIIYRQGKGGGVGYGLEASALPEVCDVWLKARDAGVLKGAQLAVAKKAEILMRGLAQVGVVALVDEATGYQNVRARNELNKILDAYIAKELLPWAKRFPDVFYQELFRLNGWQYDPVSVKRPQAVGSMTNMIVYDRLPEGVLEELKKLNPKNEKGRRSHKHHQLLSVNIGNPHLEKHIASVVTLMRVSDSWTQFKVLLRRAFPKKNDQMELINEA
jgi:hypothetical protein